MSEMVLKCVQTVIYGVNGMIYKIISDKYQLEDTGIDNAGKEPVFTLLEEAENQLKILQEFFPNGHFRILKTYKGE